MSSNDDSKILLSLGVWEVNSILAESYKCENLDLDASLFASKIQNTLQKFSLDNLRSSSANRFSHCVTVDELQWLYRLTHRAKAANCQALRVYFSSKMNAFAEGAMQRRVNAEPTTEH